MGSAGIAAWIALIAFPSLLVLGWIREDIQPKTAIVFLILGLVVYVGLPRLAPNGGGYVTPALALLDVALVFVVFKGDVRIT